MVQSPLVPVEVIEERNNPGIIESLIPQPLSHMGPVLLLDMGIIVFVVSPAAGKRNRILSLGKMSQEMMVQKL